MTLEPQLPLGDDYIDETEVSDAFLADWLFTFIDCDPSAKMAQTKRLRAEVKRRGLTRKQLEDLWASIPGRYAEQATVDSGCH